MLVISEPYRLRVREQGVVKFRVWNSLEGFPSLCVLAVTSWASLGFTGKRHKAGDAIPAPLFTKL